VAIALELRIYRCPGPRHLSRLNEQLATDGRPMFERNGITIVDAWTTSLGAPTGRLVYLCAFPDLATRDQAWRDVDADEDWQAAKGRWSEGIGPLTSELEFWMLSQTGPLTLPAGPSRPVYLGLAEGQHSGPGWCDVVLGPVGRRLYLSDSAPDLTAFSGGSDRVVRLSRCGWSPAVEAGVALDGTALSRSSASSNARVGVAS